MKTEIMRASKNVSLKVVSYQIKIFLPGRSFIKIILNEFKRKMFYFFLDVNSSDMGTYTCTAFSPRGETSWTATLTVVEKSSNSNTPLDASKLPDPPGTPRILNVTSSSVTLSWNPSSPKVGIPQIIGYTVEYYSSELQTGWLVGAHRIVSESTTVSFSTGSTSSFLNYSGF